MCLCHHLYIYCKELSQKVLSCVLDCRLQAISPPRPWAAVVYELSLCDAGRALLRDTKEVVVGAVLGGLAAGTTDWYRVLRVLLFHDLVTLPDHPALRQEVIGRVGEGAQLGEILMGALVAAEGGRRFVMEDEQAMDALIAAVSRGQWASVVEALVEHEVPVRLLQAVAVQVQRGPGELAKWMNAMLHLVSREEGRGAIVECGEVMLDAVLYMLQYGSGGFRAMAEGNVQHYWPRPTFMPIMLRCLSQQPPFVLGACLAFDMLAAEKAAELLATPGWVEACLRVMGTASTTAETRGVLLRMFGKLCPGLYPQLLQMLTVQDEAVTRAARLVLQWQGLRDREGVFTCIAQVVRERAEMQPVVNMEQATAELQAAAVALAQVGKDVAPK